MFLELFFWLLLAFSCVFGFGYATGKPWAGYGFFPVIVLIVILGLKVFGVGSLLH
jgi:hypothetical protein